MLKSTGVRFTFLTRGFRVSSLKQRRQRLVRYLTNIFLSRRLRRRHLYRNRIKFISDFLTKNFYRYSFFVSRLKKQMIGLNHLILYLLINF